MGYINFEKLKTCIKYLTCKTPIDKNLYCWKCVFCVCNFFSIKFIFYFFTYYFLTRFLVTTSVFKRASPIATLSALSSNLILEYPWAFNPSFRGRKLLRILLNSKTHLNTWTWLVLSNHIYFVIHQKKKSVIVTLSQQSPSFWWWQNIWVI